VTPRLPSLHRIETHPCEQRLVISANGQVLADTERAVELKEGRYPVRYYVPREDVRMDLLEPTESHTTCPFKGQARYWSARAGEQVLDDVAWSYEDALPEVEDIEGLIAFYNDRVTLELDGLTTG
jgi:uncharacterized protein (DUF427 family)